jgi:hypothetical protein
MPGWEMHDGRKPIGPMSEEAIIWAIKRGLPSSTQVRVAGQARWMPLDDHPPFADELVARTAGRRKKKSGKGPLGYTWQEMFALVFALGAVAGVVLGIGWLEDNWHGVRQGLEGRGQKAHRQAGLAAFEEDQIVQGETRPVRAEVPSEAPRSPTARARLASEALSGAGADPREAVCRARALLEPILEADRKKPEVERALSLLSSKELPLLRQEQSEFEKRRGVVCGDGTRPRGCPCRGAHESCCVLHGGVASCEPLPTRIRCF